MIATLYLATVALGCAGMGAFLLAKRTIFYLTAKRAAGHVIRWETRGARGRHHFPTIRFTADDGNAYELSGGPGFTSPKPLRRCTVLYSSRNPRLAMNSGFLAYWAAPIAFFFLAAAAGFAAIAQFPTPKP